MARATPDVEAQCTRGHWVKTSAQDNATINCRECARNRIDGGRATFRVFRDAAKHGRVNVRPYTASPVLDLRPGTGHPGTPVKPPTSRREPRKARLQKPSPVMAPKRAPDPAPEPVSKPIQPAPIAITKQKIAHNGNVIPPQFYRPCSTCLNIGPTARKITGRNKEPRYPAAIVRAEITDSTGLKQLDLCPAHTKIWPSDPNTLVVITEDYRNNSSPDMIK